MKSTAVKPATSKPNREQLLAAEGALVPDLIAEDLNVLFCGINPSLYSAAVGHHFARPGNRFWPSLHAGGFTPRRLDPSEEADLLTLGYGITNVFERATAAAAEISSQDIIAGGDRLHEKVLKYRPQVLAILGITAYRMAFAAPKARMGHQSQKIGDTHIWVLPNPSGLNAHYQLADLAEIFRELRFFVEGRD